AGEYCEARDHLEHALGLFKPGRDDDLAFRFGTDVGVQAMSVRALVLWPLGDVERAVSQVGSAEARTAGLAHIGTRAYANMIWAMLEVLRGDFSRVSANGLELSRLAREHELPFWEAY